MDITYLGAGSVKLSGKNLNVVCDPYDETVGLGKLNVKADVVTLSTTEGMGQVQNAMVLDGPGEYEVKSVMITGVPSRLHIDEDGTRGTIYSILMDGVNVVVVGNIAGKLDNRQLGALGNVDVLILPVGGHGLTLEPEEAAAVAAQLEPGYIVPVHFDDGKTKYPVPQAKLDDFLKEIGSKPEPESKLRVNAKEAPSETQVVVLKRAGE